MSAQRRLSLVVCGAGPAPHVAAAVSLAQADGWLVQLIATSSALTFIDTDELERLSGSPVRSDYATSGARPRASANDAVLIAPATYNTINKLALGINDTYALNVAAEAIGRGTP